MDIEEAAESFASFAHLPRYLRSREERLYNVATGRAGAEVQNQIDELDRLARKFFAPCRLSANPLRQHHYRLLYGRGSEFTHSAPVAVFATIDLKNEPEELANWILGVDAQEERELREISSIATVFLFEIAVLIGRRLPDFDVLWCVDIGTPMTGRMLGLPEPMLASMRRSFLRVA